MTIDQAVQLASQHHQAGRLDEAAAIYRRALSVAPKHPDALHLLGLLLHQQGRNEEAVELIRRAIAEQPATAIFHSNLASVLNAQGKTAEAIAAGRMALSLDSADSAAMNHVGTALHEMGRCEEAEQSFRKALALRPNYAAAWFNLSRALGDLRRFDEAAEACNRSIALQPQRAESHAMLGNILSRARRFKQAIAPYRRALAMQPESADAWFDLGSTLFAAGIEAESEAAYRNALRLKPDHVLTLNNLFVLLRQSGRMDEAAEALAQALALRPDAADPRMNYAMLLRDQGQIEKAMAEFRRAIAIDPQRAAIYGALLYSMHFDPRSTPRSIFHEHCLWHAVHARPLEEQIRPHENDRSPHRRLRIGYVSPDFRHHATAPFTLALLSNHRRDEFEIYCYSDVTVEDFRSAEFRPHANVWRDITPLSDAEAADAIRADRIDILIDLALHTAGRPLLFARKPAPVQAHWLGYPGTSGSLAMDYRITDPYLDPPGGDDAFYFERSVRLPEAYWCAKRPDSCPPVNALPALETGHVTFGSMNGFLKLNDAVIDRWGDVLNGVENSRMLIAAPEGSARRRVIERMGAKGIDAGRLEFSSRIPYREYMKLHHRIDIMLDAYPWTGHATSVNSLWMAVPIVTLFGATAPSRGTLSMLSNLGLADWATDSPQEYVRIAIEKAADLPRLAELRSTLRQRVEESPLGDCARFARNMETAYRRMWLNWCAGAPGAPIELTDSI